MHGTDKVSAQEINLLPPEDEAWLYREHGCIRRTCLLDPAEDGKVPHNNDYIRYEITLLVVSPQANDSRGGRAPRGD